MEPERNHLNQRIGPVVPNWKPPAAPSRQPMEGRFCRLEALNPDRHASSLYAANALDEDGRIWTYLPYGPFDNFDLYRRWVDGVSRGSDPMFFAVVNLATELAEGVASFLRVDPANGSVEVGHI